MENDVISLSDDDDSFEDASRRKLLSSKKGNQHVESLYNGDEADGFDMLAADEWIYPTNYAVRDYQKNIVTSALFQNTLVCLPTGLGKTFIAAVVMYNLHRWYPKHKVVFMAHSKPLVAQQLQACSQIMGVSPCMLAELNGNISLNNRKVLWETKKFFFLTPQVFNNDMARGVVSPHSIRCLVVDEAHKALGNQAYCQAIKALQPFNRSFRVLALSATPGDDIPMVKAVVENLLISHLEIRSETDHDIKKYLHERSVEAVVVNLDSKILEFREQVQQVANKYLKYLLQQKAINSSFGSVNSFSLVLRQKQFVANPSVGPEHRGLVLSNFSVAISLLKAAEELVIHGLRTFLTKLLQIKSGDCASNNVHNRLSKDPDFDALIRAVEDYIGKDRDIAFDPNISMARLQDELDAQVEKADLPLVYSHPKFVVLEEIIVKHFEERQAKNESTRVIVFCKSRPCTGEICNFLNKFRPLIKPMVLIGQSNTGGGSTSKGLKQSAQLEVMRKFRAGNYNTLVATCVGEEGLDVGEVDLIVNFDSSRNSNTQVQRSGRTGRKRAGRVVNLLTEGKEYQDYNVSLAKAKNMQTKLSKGLSNLPLYPHSIRLLPDGVNPMCQEMYLKSSDNETSFPPKPKNKKENAKDGVQPEQAPSQKCDIRLLFSQESNKNKPTSSHEESSGSLFESVGAVEIYKEEKSKKKENKNKKKCKEPMKGTQTLKQMFEKAAAKKNEPVETIYLDNLNDEEEMIVEKLTDTDIPSDLKQKILNFENGTEIIKHLEHLKRLERLIGKSDAIIWQSQLESRHCDVLDSMTLEEVVSLVSKQFEQVRIAGQYDCFKQYEGNFFCCSSSTVSSVSSSEEIEVTQATQKEIPSNFWNDDDIFDFNMEVNEANSVDNNVLPITSFKGGHCNSTLTEQMQKDETPKKSSVDKRKTQIIPKDGNASATKALNNSELPSKYFPEASLVTVTQALAAVETYKTAVAKRQKVAMNSSVNNQVEVKCNDLLNSSKEVLEDSDVEFVLPSPVSQVSSKRRVQSSQHAHSEVSTINKSDSQRPKFLSQFSKPETKNKSESPKTVSKPSSPYKQPLQDFSIWPDSPIFDVATQSFQTQKKSSQKSPKTCSPMIAKNVSFKTLTQPINASNIDKLNDETERSTFSPLFRANTSKAKRGLKFEDVEKVQSSTQNWIPDSDDEDLFVQKENKLNEKISKDFASQEDVLTQLYDVNEVTSYVNLFEKAVTSTQQRSEDALNEITSHINMSDKAVTVMPIKETVAAELPVTKSKPKMAIVRPFYRDSISPSESPWVSTKVKPKSPTLLSIVKGHRKPNKSPLSNNMNLRKSYLSSSSAEKPDIVATACKANASLSTFDCIPDDLADIFQCSGFDLNKQSTPHNRKKEVRTDTASHFEDDYVSDGALDAIKAVEELERSTQAIPNVSVHSAGNSSVQAVFNLWSSDDSDVFEDKTQSRRQRALSVKKRKRVRKQKKKKSGKLAKGFIDEEAVLSDCEDECSSDDEDSSGLDQMDSSFLDERLAPTQAPGIDMTARYLATVRSPRVAAGAFKMPQSALPDFSVCSQVDDNNDEDYEHDSFCVDDISEAVECEMSALELAEMILYKRKKRRRNEESVKSPTPDKTKKKRRRIMVVSSSSEEDQVPDDERKRSSTCKNLTKRTSHEVKSKNTCEVFVSNKNVSMVSALNATCDGPLRIFIGSRQIASAPEITTSLRAKWKCKIEVRSSPGADFIVSWRMGICRFTLSDFTNGAPTMDSCIKETVSKMMTIFLKAVIIVEDDKNKSAPRTVGLHQGLWVKHSAKRLVRLQQAGVQLIFVRNKDETAEVISNLASIENSKGHGVIPDWPEIPAEVESHLQFYSSLPGINVVNALKLCRKFSSITSFLSVCDSVGAIQRETGVSRNSASEMYLVLHNQ